MLPSNFMSHDNFDLAAAARQEMIDHGFAPDFPPEAERQLETIRLQPDPSLRDLTALLWSSIDNDDSRDLDQIEWAERVPGGIRVLVGVADVDSAVAKATPIDSHAARETTTVYAGVRTFPMLPERLSTDLTSLNEDQDRAGIVIEMVVAADGSIASNSIYRALLRNRAQLAYSTVGAWLEGTAAPPPKVAASADLQAQLKLQDEAAQALREAPPPAGRAHLRPPGSAAGLRRRRGDGYHRSRPQSRRATDRRFHDRRQRGDGPHAARRRRLLHPPRGEGSRALAAHRGAGGAIRREAARRRPIPERSTLSSCGAKRPTPCTTPIFRYRS